MEEIRCIFCDRANETVAVEEDGYVCRLCAQCELIYVSPRPTADEIVDLYSHGEAHLSPGHHLRTLHLKRLYARHHLGLIAAHARTGRVLEVGAGGGAFLAEAQRQGFEPYGIELSTEQAAHIRDALGIPCETEPMTPSSFGELTFDVIYHSDVLGHFSDPIAELRASHELLNPSGLLVVETGNLPDVDPANYRYYSSYQLPDHLFSFGRKSLRMLLERSGFELVALHTYSTVPQLRVMRLLGAMRRMVLGSRPASTPATPRAAAGPPKTPARPGLRYKLVRWPFDWLMYVLRYGVGAVAPKEGRPQTLIVIARKSAATTADAPTEHAQSM